MPKDQEIHKAANLDNAYTYKGKDDEIIDILKAGGDPNVKGAQNRAPLHRAVGKKHDNVVEVLLQYKADVSAIDNSGYTAMHWAGMFGAVECAKMLVEAKADFNVGSKSGDTPLHLAAEKNKIAFINYAIGEGADTGLANSKGETPATVAGKSGNKDAQNLLKPEGGGCCIIA